ncbi:Testicular acid phosphatase-like protein [Dinothrombium tinctorium]|uniref:acid phosphatase n=1 Tax=Dinothrombium tinctorium TaxID=1965070 RepID=A0A443QZZ4_9ACAR|nr:Testicular acid phosphatase-like protein [Dinothrombium tinctorium]
MGFEIPNWAFHPIMQQLDGVAAHAFYFPFSTRKLQQLRAGPLLQEVIEVLSSSEEVREERKWNSEKRLFIYSTHDTMLAALLTALEVYNMKAPPFGATIIFELYKTDNGKRFITALYLNETESENPIVLRLPACNRKESCSFETFISNTKYLIPKNWRHKCGLKNLEEEENDQKLDFKGEENITFFGKVIKKVQNKTITYHSKG